MSGRDENNTKAQKPIASLPTETLEDMLRWYALSDNDVSEDFISEIISELKSREKDDNVEPNVDQALSDFFEIYANEESEYLSYGETSQHDSDQITYDKPKHRRLVRAIAVLAAVIALLMATTAIAYAAGYDVFSTVANWASETFNLEYNRADEAANAQESTNVGANYSGIAEVVEEYGLHGSVEPKWIPPGLGEPAIEVDEFNNRLTVTAIYNDGDKFLMVSANEIDGRPVGMIYEIDSKLMSVYTHNNIKFYIMSNYDVITVVWNSGDFECSISGNYSGDTVKTIIDSI